jgi:hypothetical protein
MRTVTTRTAVTGFGGTRDHCRMRILRLILVAVAAAVAVLVGPRAASALESFVMTLSPSFGPASTAVTASYTYTSQGSRGAERCDFQAITFTWDGQLLGSKTGEFPDSRGGGQGQRGYCVARLTFMPPSGLNGSGRHIVRGQGEKHRVDAAFTVTAGGAAAPGQPTQAASPTRPGGVAADVTRTAQPTAQPSTRHTTPTPTAAPPSAATVGEPISAAATIAAAATKPTSGGPTGTVVAIIAIGLGIIGAGLLVVLALRQRTSSEKEQEVVADAVSTKV